MMIISISKPLFTLGLFVIMAIAVGTGAFVGAGVIVGADVVVLSGVQQGDKIITDGFQRLRNKGKITLGKPKAAGAPAAK